MTSNERPENTYLERKECQECLYRLLLLILTILKSHRTATAGILPTKSDITKRLAGLTSCSPLSSGFPALLCNSQGLTGFGTLSLFGQAASDQLAQDSGLSLFHLLALHQPWIVETERC